MYEDGVNIPCRFSDRCLRLTSGHVDRLEGAGGDALGAAVAASPAEEGHLKGCLLPDGLDWALRPGGAEAISTVLRAASGLIQNGLWHETPFIPALEYNHLVGPPGPL